MRSLGRVLLCSVVVVVVIDLVLVMSRVALFMVNHTRLKNNFMTRKKIGNSVEDSTTVQKDYSTFRPIYVFPVPGGP